MDKSTYDSENAYNNKGGIVEMISTLEGFNRLIRERQAACQRQELMQGFYVKGRWCAHANGNFWKIKGEFIPKELFPDIPDVLTTQECSTFIREQHVGRYELQIYTSSSDDVPLADLPCAECMQSWTINNCHDVVVVDDEAEEIVSLADYVGKQLEEVSRGPWADGVVV